jgi:two-component system sensor histidine kinase TorS
VVERNHRRMAEMISKALQAGRLEVDAVKPSPADVRLGELLDEMVLRAEARARERGLSFRADYDADLPLHVDRELTASAIRNLVENAIKYTDSGGVEVNVRAGPSEVEFHVSDTCVGLSQEELATIFEPFKRGRTTRTGTGLGLAIAHRAVEIQGGSIHAESKGARGCHFWIALPRTRH